MHEGYIHSIETCGTVDGPGVRYVIFFQGCPMRCLYCHNPDTWAAHVGQKMTVDEVLKGYFSNIAFYRKGGVTVTGGEAMLQMDFLIELFTKCKENNVHTCLDTSGIVYNEHNASFMKKLDKLLDVTDLVMLDIKHIQDEEHKKLTAHSNVQILKFAKYLDMKNISVWIRHVVVPGYTLFGEYLNELGCFLGTLNNIKALDVLPYHSMGISKYQEMNIPYPLMDTRDATKDEAMMAKNIILKAYHNQKEKETCYQS